MSTTIQSSDGLTWDDSKHASLRETILQKRENIKDLQQCVFSLQRELESLRASCTHEKRAEPLKAFDYRDEYDYDNREGYAIKIIVTTHRCLICDYIWKTKEDV